MSALSSKLLNHFTCDTGWMITSISHRKRFRGLPLVVQWLRVCLTMQGTWVPSLVGGLRSCMPWRSRAHVPQLLKAEHSGAFMPQLESLCAPVKGPTSCKWGPVQTKDKWILKRAVQALGAEVSAQNTQLTNRASSTTLIFWSSLFPLHQVVLILGKGSLGSRTVWLRRNALGSLKGGFLRAYLFLQEKGNRKREGLGRETGHPVTKRIWKVATH